MQLLALWSLILKSHGIFELMDHRFANRLYRFFNKKRLDAQSPGACGVWARMLGFCPPLDLDYFPKFEILDIEIGNPK